MIMYTWKILEGLVPNCGVIATDNPRLGRKCVIPNLFKNSSVKNQRESSFQVTGPKLFNSMPKRIRDMRNCSIADFKLALDEVLTVVPDEPNVPGLNPSITTPGGQYTNSLIHWMPAVTRSAWMKSGSC